jgi:hypothetical protein
LDKHSEKWTRFESKRDPPENTAARMLERVSGPFQFVPLAGVSNDPAEQARLSPPKMLSGANIFEISDHQFKPR